MASNDQQRDGFEVVTFGGEVINFVACDSDHESLRERVMMGMLRNLRDDCFVRDTRDRTAAER
jgi:hypothetical protein